MLGNKMDPKLNQLFTTKKNKKKQKKNETNNF